MSTTPMAVPLTPLQQVLNAITLGASVASQLGTLNPDVAAGGTIALALTQIVAQVAAAHQSLTGQAMDLTLLHDIEPVPDSAPPMNADH